MRCKPLYESLESAVWHINNDKPNTAIGCMKGLCIIYDGTKIGNHLTQIHTVMVQHVYKGKGMICSLMKHIKNYNEKKECRCCGKRK